MIRSLLKYVACKNRKEADEIRKIIYTVNAIGLSECNTNACCRDFSLNIAFQMDKAGLSLHRSLPGKRFSIMDNEEYLVSLIHELCKFSQECAWVEFKQNNSEKREIGRYLSALSNSAMLCGKSSAYVVWGVQDQTHEIVGTTFDPFTQKVGNEELENWLLQRLSPKLYFRFQQVSIQKKRVVVLEIPAAAKHPTSFQNEEFIRVGSYRKKLKDLPEIERELWRALDQTPFEALSAIERISGDKVLDLLDYPNYFDLLQLPLPDGRQAIISALEKDEIISIDDAGLYAITNLGAILFAKNLDQFQALKGKAVRVIQYDGENKIQHFARRAGVKGMLLVLRD